MPRLRMWPERLAGFIEARRHQPFAWGRQDCISFAADGVVEITGRDPMAPWRGRYASEDEADALMPLGLEAAVVEAMAAFGAAEVSPDLAGRGDVAIMTLGNMATCGLHLGLTVAAPGAEGLRFLPAGVVRRAWRV